jgi:hypothetical protein
LGPYIIKFRWRLPPVTIKKIKTGRKKLARRRKNLRGDGWIKTGKINHVLMG